MDDVLQWAGMISVNEVVVRDKAKAPINDVQGSNGNQGLGGETSAHPSDLRSELAIADIKSVEQGIDVFLESARRANRRLTNFTVDSVKNIELWLDRALEGSPSAQAKVSRPSSLAAAYLCERELYSHARSIVNEARERDLPAPPNLIAAVEHFPESAARLFEKAPEIKSILKGHYLERSTNQLWDGLRDVPYLIERKLRMNGFEVHIPIAAIESLDVIDAANKPAKGSWEARHSILPMPVDRVRVLAAQRENGEVIFEVHLNRQNLMDFRAEQKMKSWEFVTNALEDEIKGAMAELATSVRANLKQEIVQIDSKWISARYVVAPLVGSAYSIEKQGPDLRVGLPSDFCRPQELRELDAELQARKRATSSWPSSVLDKFVRLGLSRAQDLCQAAWALTEPVRNYLEKTFMLPKDQRK